MSDAIAASITLGGLAGATLGVVAGAAMGAAAARREADRLFSSTGPTGATGPIGAPGPGVYQAAGALLQFADTVTTTVPAINTFVPWNVTDSDVILGNAPLQNIAFEYAGNGVIRYVGAKPVIFIFAI